MSTLGDYIAGWRLIQAFASFCLPDTLAGFYA